ncbi:peptidoglycan DD-metalloendopeptidase family protein [Aeromicrobium sp. Sec7.5]|uniref:peptidoglycan DD-metalloendopeptidase family protein n=1 Tax=Aeromicrobium sp. Sec7.5 TaxID=3121276 RepID=UPI002FE49F07
MRSTPRSALLAFTLTFALIATLAGPSLAESKDELERKKNATNSELSGAQQSYDESSKAAADAAAVLQASQAQLAEAQSALGSVRGQLVAAQALDAQMQVKLEQSEADLAQAESDLAAGEQDVEASTAEVVEFTVESLQDAGAGLRAFNELVSGADPTEFTEQVAINNTIADSQLSKLDTLDATRVLLDINEQKVQALRDQVQVERDAAAANLANITVLEQQAAAQEASVAQLVQANSTNKSAADAAVAADASDIAALEADRNALEAELQRLAAEELARANANANSGGGGGGGGGGSSTGKLSYPLSSVRITSPYGFRIHPITGKRRLHDGMDFGAGCGTPIKAAANGTIVSQYYNSGYGNRVILNNGVINGANIVTTYNHLSRFAVSPGQRVSRGQTIGYVGTTGSSTGCHLHFMVLVNGSHTNPANWIG